MMKNHALWTILAHATMLLSALFLTITIIDRFNPQMEFLNSDITDMFLLAFSICGLSSSMITAIKIFRRDKARRRHGEKEE